MSLKTNGASGPEVNARSGRKSKKSTSGGLGGFLRGLRKAADDVLGPVPGSLAPYARQFASDFGHGIFADLGVGAGQKVFDGYEGTIDILNKSTLMVITTGNGEASDSATELMINDFAPTMFETEGGTFIKVGAVDEDGSPFVRRKVHPSANAEHLEVWMFFRHETLRSSQSCIFKT
ncbi:hypothetical protein EJ05DRAFT_498421 [Pseudovirgaria hyperparasitica]|uniref:Uncharacterized protein n=1 Tax=Pseudovirgaria hyperparasitica TaxID=470096 RepID=A0A6A6WEP5_9PEZI|nr:uncharacterized protein EJ05DRAFT_498421 [Pseudovirgaria hyperparasitica]KAF2760460.1 hypothetical protein EJ05DRAFT_498421 [Pseudovirgaria hyperparasitica]